MKTPDAKRRPGSITPLLVISTGDGHLHVGGDRLIAVHPDSFTFQENAMKCPIDNTDLAMTDRQGIEIDYCPKCRGVWLDRGELDKLIDRAAPATAPAAAHASQPVFSQPHQPYGHHRPKKHKSLLGELFDF